MSKLTVGRKLVVEGGELSEPWVPETAVETLETGEGPETIEFLKLCMKDRHLAHALGMNCEQVSPFQNTSLFKHLEELRDAKVDELIMEDLFSKDPMAKKRLGGSKVAVPMIGRETKFHKANIPPVIWIHVSHDDIGRDIRVVATAKRGVNVYIECTEDNLQWLRDAICLVWNKKKNRKTPASLADLPELEDGLKWRQRGEVLAIAVDYYKDDKKRTHQKVVKRHEDPHVFSELVRQASSACLEFYYKNHQEPTDGPREFGDENHINSDVLEASPSPSDGDTPMKASSSPAPDV